MKLYMVRYITNTNKLTRVTVCRAKRKEVIIKLLMATYKIPRNNIWVKYIPEKN